ncbi:ThiF family adenylyltransferase [Stieleria sp. TO1_6]|uniref:ThiF family adenylyltransferase n=1 Tax=Stieleria tagensis TaxID=2956795 RepID=UPI00209B3061|nr:ThiF family adenylyltransferase [Stieleria tagensis]MCO8123384.1 ThiF family adenylyltransferase [Stieleria tagensis]
MSRQLFNLNEDLRKLRDEGYCVQVHGGYLVMKQVPYVNAEGQVCRGAFASRLHLAGDKTKPPDDHTILFIGESPYSGEDRPITTHSSVNERVADDLVATLKFSRKPPGGYRDYHHQMTVYAGIFAGPAEAIDPDANPRVFRRADEGEDGVFQYTDTLTSRVGTGAATQSLREERIVIIGLGGTGAYILDLVTKTPVSEVRIIDGDLFETHTAFRSPGAASIDCLREEPKKVDFYREKYSKMHRNIVAHAVMLDASNLHLLDGVTFAFVCIDDGPAKKEIFAKLETIGVPFIDCGMGIDMIDGSMTGIIRTTTSLPDRRGHVYGGNVSFAGGGERDLYSSNIQIAELNSLNAALAVIKWKKIRQFYHDSLEELQSLYTIDVDTMVHTEPLQELPLSKLDRNDKVAS